MSRRETLRAALTRVHLRVTLFAVGMAGLTVLFAGFATMRSYAQQNLALIAKTASYNAAPALVFRDREAAHDALRPLAQAEGVSALVLSGNDGRPFAAIDKAGQPLGWTTQLLSTFAPATIEEPVLHNGARVGLVQVKGDASAIADYVAIGLLGAIACLLLTAVAAWALARRLQASIIAQLQGIADTAHAVRIDRNLSQRAPPATIAEIATLSSDFNALLDELEMQHRQLQHENAALNHLATHDPLTGLHNRAAFERRLAFAIDGARLNRQSFAVVYIDGDNFKAVNDRHGHHAGDRVLKALAAALKGAVRPGDTVARMGGDEFAVLLAAPSEAADAQRMIDALDHALAEAVILPGQGAVQLTTSSGFALYPDDGDDVATLLRKADKAMYRAKAARQQHKQTDLRRNA